MEHWSAEELLDWALNRFHPDIAVASSFGPESAALLHLAVSVRRDVRIFTLDTGFLFPETHKLIDEIEQLYGLKVERIYPALSPE